MNHKLGGSLFVYNGISMDYCVGESIKCLQEFCDEVVILDAGSTDGTQDYIRSLADKKTTIITLPNEEWQKQRGKWKLSYFTNIAISALDSEYNFNLQADELVHEDSYDAVRKACETGQEAFLCKRINLWGSPYTQLNVEHHRKPCSTEIVRLAKTIYKSYDDAESLQVPFADVGYYNAIRIYHMGFVRKREVHPRKIRHMQAEVFEVGVDAKLEGMEIFDGSKWFDYEKDLKQIDEPLPNLIQQWAKERE